jgi:L-aspartate oxidase
LLRTVDYLIIGSGLAGLTAALKLPRNSKVLIITRAEVDVGSSPWAQGGIAAAVSVDDNSESHYRDTIEAGAFLCNEESVKILTEEGPQAIENLIEWGVNFSKSNSDSQYPYHLALEGGHSKARILNAKDLTGWEIVRALVSECKSRSNIEILEFHQALDLVTEEVGSKKRVIGAEILDLKNCINKQFCAKAVFLSTGGASQAYPHTTNPEVSTGDGMAMAVRAGAQLEDMEFVQFHPTSLYETNSNSGSSFLISEALRGEGAILRNHLGFAFMQGKHPLKDLAPRDIVAREIDAQIKEFNLNHVWLDTTHIPIATIEHHFPKISEKCKSIGIDLSKDMIPVVPAAHYYCGGVKVDTHGSTGISGLYACGETSCTGVHGANRLASNSLLESIVFTNRAVKHCLNSPAPQISCPIMNESGLKKYSMDAPVPERLLANLKSILWEHCGIVRNDHDIERGLERVCHFSENVQEVWLQSTELHPAWTNLRNLIIVAEATLLGAYERKESRGLNFNTDHLNLYSTEKHFQINAEDIQSLF